MELGSEGILRGASGAPMLEYTLRGAVIRLEAPKQRKQNNIFGELEENICRVCLSTDSNAFYHILDCGLQNDFQNITGIQISPDDELPKLICCICRKLLKKAAAFRNKSISVQKFLSLGRVTVNDRNTVTTPLICFTHTETLLISIPPASPTEDIETIIIDLEEEITKTEENVDKECKDKVIDSETYEKAEANEHLFDDHDDFDMEYEVTSDANNDSDKNVVKVKDVNITKSVDTAKPKAEDKTVGERMEFCKKYNMEIKILTLDEMIAEVKNRANMKRYKNSRYKCDVCFIGFQFERSFSYHMKGHDPNISGNVKCEVCNKMFFHRQRMVQHKNEHKFRFLCKECGRICKTQTIAKEHALTHSSEEFKCEYCPKTFCKPGSRKNHVRLKHGSQPCDICYVLLTPLGLNMHKICRHKETFKCEYCNKKFNDAAALAAHASDSTNGVCSERPCTRCGEGFSTESEWSAHVEDHRREAKRYDSMKQVAYIYKKKYDRKEPSERLENVMCEICGNTFNSDTAMRYHQRIHTGEKPHACTYCPKRFRMGYQLKAHINTHTGERPYKCEKCPKDFKNQNGLYRHQLVHTKLRRHRCTMCESTFQTSTSLKLHVQSVHFLELKYGKS